LTKKKKKNNYKQTNKQKMDKYIKRKKEESPEKKGKEEKEEVEEKDTKKIKSEEKIKEGKQEVDPKEKPKKEVTPNPLIGKPVSEALKIPTDKLKTIQDFENHFDFVKILFLFERILIFLFFLFFKKKSLLITC
jgi:hypothetical protein